MIEFFAALGIANSIVLAVMAATFWDPALIKEYQALIAGVLGLVGGLSAFGAAYMHIQYIKKRDEFTIKKNRRDIRRSFSTDLFKLYMAIFQNSSNIDYCKTYQCIHNIIDKFPIINIDSCIFSALSDEESEEILGIITGYQIACNKTYNTNNNPDDDPGITRDIFKKEVTEIGGDILDFAIILKDFA